MADGDDEATVSAWLRRENTSLLAKNKQLRVELKQAENTAAGGIDVDALRQKIARQGREIEELQGKAAASDEVAALQQQLEAKDAERDAVQQQGAAQHAELRQQAKQTVKHQKVQLKEQAAEVARLTVELDGSRAELATKLKELKQLRAEYKITDQQREENTRRAAEAEQKRSAAVAEVAKLQQAAEGWQQQRLKAQAKFNQLKARLTEAKTYVSQQNEQIEQLKNQVQQQQQQRQQQQQQQQQGSGDLATSVAPAAAVVPQPVELTRGGEAAEPEQKQDDDAEDDGGGELFGEDVELLAGGGVQEYIYQIEREHRDEREALDAQIVQQMMRIAEKAFGTDSTCGMASRVACHHAAELEMQLGGAAPRLEQLVQSDAAAAAALAAGEDHGRTALQRPTATAPSLPVGTAIAFAPSALGTADAGSDAGLPIGTVVGNDIGSGGTTPTVAGVGGADGALAIGVGQLVEIMGCTAQQAGYALAATGGDLDAACELLISGAAVMASPPAAPQPPPDYASLVPQRAAEPPLPPPSPRSGVPLTVRILGHRKVADYFVYRMSCIDEDGDTWVAEARFSEFASLREFLMAAEAKLPREVAGTASSPAPANSWLTGGVGTVGRLPFPGKLTMSSMFQSEADTLSQRAEALQTWLSGAVEAPVATTPGGLTAFRRFLHRNVE